MHISHCMNISIYFPFKLRYLAIRDDFGGGSAGKEPAWQHRRLKRYELDPWVRKIRWNRKWQPVPVFLPEKFHGQRSLVCYHNRVTKSRAGLSN